MNIYYLQLLKKWNQLPIYLKDKIEEMERRRMKNEQHYDIKRII